MLYQMKNNMETRKGYLCEIAWTHETEAASSGVTIYPSVKDLKKHHPLATCGIVAISMQFIRNVRKTDFSKEEGEVDMLGNLQEKMQEVQSLIKQEIASKQREIQSLQEQLTWMSQITDHQVEAISDISVPSVRQVNQSEMATLRHSSMQKKLKRSRPRIDWKNDVLAKLPERFTAKDVMTQTGLPSQYVSSRLTAFNKAKLIARVEPGVYQVTQSQ